MYQTIRLSSCVSVQGEIVEVLKNGDVVVRDGRTMYRGRPVAEKSATIAAKCAAAPETSAKPVPAEV